MPNFLEPVSTTFMAVSIVVIFVIVGISILAVQKVKKAKEI
ncbi:hypothetical protein [Sulfurimonas sp.]|jgi:hypothetical protein|nr:hypothetical protein [Sulfurimonas sp.]